MNGYVAQGLGFVGGTLIAFTAALFLPLGDGGAMLLGGVMAVGGMTLGAWLAER